MWVSLLLVLVVDVHDYNCSGRIVVAEVAENFVGQAVADGSMQVIVNAYNSSLPMVQHLLKRLLSQYRDQLSRRLLAVVYLQLGRQPFPRLS